MSRLVFWDAGQGSAAETAVACAVTMGLNHPRRVLLMNESRSGSGVEEGLRLPVAAGAGEHAADMLPEHGVDALLRLSASRRLASSNFADYTMPLLRGHLDLACGTRTGGLSLTGAGDREFGELLLKAEQVYDLVVLHIQGRRRLNEALRGRREGDVVVVVLPQRRAQLDDFFADAAPYVDRRSPGLCIVINPFDPRSHWSLANIRRRYKCPLPMFGITHLTEFADAWNDRDCLAFFRKYRLLAKRAGSREKLLEGYRELSGKLLELAAVASFPVKEKGA